jgi:hypothetical protein
MRLILAVALMGSSTLLSAQEPTPPSFEEQS